MDKVDILYIIGKRRSEWRDNELRYSLRSIAKNGINVGRVFVCGYCPYWLNTENVVCVPFTDPTPDNKHLNILSAIEYAIEHTDISEHFLYSSDDHFYVQPTDFAKYPVYWRGYDLPKEQDGKRWYDITMHSTYSLLAAFGLPTLFFAWHGNTHFNTRLWKQDRMVILRAAAKLMPECCDPHCLMLNYWLEVERKTMPKRIVRADGKINGTDTVEGIERVAAAKEVISSTDVAGDALRAYLRREFPKPCKYERQE